ncbi:hypothetical protein [Burkholderia multivorans]|uniref:hypothetical protein n=1 Tax=Burkholderia multivorans TaxID=87883 RepID=UPI001C24598A|nr:hypothetical protein [Burkholderia multivorans]MBU9219379.1 hypothetical protein [Burkholderia multivorans]MBU9419810.1 hypothetical protein [Burkholderia multivorans]MBU9479544.1 hypothetical protein [Burkholderia multivorans]
MKRVCLIVHRQICSALGSVPIRREYALRIAGFWFVPRMPHHHERVFGTNGVDALPIPRNCTALDFSLTVLAALQTASLRLFAHSMYRCATR